MAHPLDTRGIVGGDYPVPQANNVRRHGLSMPSRRWLIQSALVKLGR